ncbi:RagB/SusD family nutrient uptake outer membrane protein [Sunxiuqinia sp. A32]|uniref:RagB/SusD family nutrient uptake outer membrane protein n=1 Tax=Sunxiuqinia sp. A32 TaxID=3461496 RepID=UPI004045CEE9
MKAKYIQIILFLFLIQGCKSILDEPVHSEFAGGNLLTTEPGIESLLFDAYSWSSNMLGPQSQHEIKRAEMTADILTQTGGGEHGNATYLLNFTWDATTNDDNAFMWGSCWNAIRNANIVLDNIMNVENINEQDRERISAEARFIRAIEYYDLWNQYGGVPLRKSTNDPLELPRVGDDELISFVIAELEDIEQILPAPGNEPNHGRANSGAVRAFLTKIYLNTMQWQDAADMSQKIISNGYYELYPDYNEMFALENEQNSEFIWVRSAYTNNEATSNTCTATAFPWGFYKALDGGIEGVTQQGWTNWASQYRLYDEFYFSFSPNDTRKKRILTKYIHANGDTINLLATPDNTRSMKYPPDPNATGNMHGNDIPFIRYADILLSRAEALNEIQGPNSESISLINQIRSRAGIEDLSLSDYNSKDELRDHILDERRWEFWYEGKRRRDLLRMGKFIEFAQSRGVTNAQEFHRKFPIPQYALEANPLLEQNAGY